MNFCELYNIDFVIILEKLIKKYSEEKENLDDENWKDAAKKIELNEKILEIKEFLNVYIGCLDLINEPEFQKEAEEEIEKTKIKIRDYIFNNYLSIKEKEDVFFMEIKTGVGGLDAQDWTEMLLKMYIRCFEKYNYKFEIISKQADTGIKNVTIKVYAPLYKFLGEAGIHRLVRISPFNAQKKRQTSFSSVYIYGNIKNININIKEIDLKIDTFRASGAGGQHVNKTESAIRITHIPTGIVVSCQNERSQQQNREEAINMLKNKLIQEELEKMKTEQKILEKEEVTWGQQFRSYVLDPYKIIKDNRLNIEINSNVSVLQVLNGDIDIFLDGFLWYKFISIINNIK